MKTEKCDKCGKGFTDEEWNLRHTMDDDIAWHEGCCPTCNEDSTESRTEK